MRLVRHLVAGLSVAALAAWSAATVAHEFWIEPSSFQLRPEERVDFRLCIGDGGDAWAVARDASRIETFASIGPDGQVSVPGLHGSDPAGVARFTAPGGYVVAYETNHARTTQTAAQFDEYLSGSRARDDRRRAPQARRWRAKGARGVLPARKGTARSRRRADTAAGSCGGPAPGVDPGWFATYTPRYGREHLSPAPPRPAARRRARHGSGTRIGVGDSAGTLRCARTGELHAAPGRDLAHQRGSHGPRRSRSRCRLGESLGVARIRPACRHGAT